MSGAVQKPVVPIVPARASLAIPPAAATDPARKPVDTRGRAIRDLRISVTDRCNFRCTYCMPKDVFGDDHPFLPRSEILTYDEIVRLATSFHALGVEKIRLTGGEPLLRRNIEGLVQMLSTALPEVDLTLTTNGSALAQKARALREAGLRRVTVSLDSLDDATFRAMNDADFPLGKVLDAIDVASREGLHPLKINMVVKKGTNDHEVIDMARRFRGTGHVVRFIEFMDVGATNGWRMDDVVPSAEIVRRINAVFPCEPTNPNHQGEVAKRWRYKDGSGEFGVISSVTEAFCHSCNRARLSTDGQVYTCLFAERGYDLKSLIRGGASDDALLRAITAIWGARTDRYSEIRTAETVARRAKVEMSFIGG